MNIVGIRKNILHFISSARAVFYYRYPAKGFIVVGVTGTDGKTTTSNIIFHILKSSEKKALLISTVGIKTNERQKDLGLHVTTPDAWFIQKHLYGLKKEGYKYAVIEMTSHGLDQHRTLGTNVLVGIITNLTHEHLDYHKTIYKYARAKSRLFRRAKYAVYAKSELSYPIYNLFPKNIKRIDYLATKVPHEIKKAINKQFPQEYNQKNALAAYQALNLLKISDNDFINGLSSFKGTKGRFEEIENKRGFRIIIDFAHTPNAIRAVLSHLHSIKKTRLIVMFGSAGERDKGKRPLMGKIASKYADVIVLTSEDPRTEKTTDINNSIKLGIRRNKNFKGEIYEKEDRYEAINFILNSLAKKGDIVVFCGKGHEKSINIGGIEHKWDERRNIIKALKENKKL